MKIALDYDLTYSANPLLFRTIIQACKNMGVDIRVVTIRDSKLDRTAPLVELEKELPVIYTNGVAKKWYCTHFAGDFQPDVWIDDKPESILNNSSATPEILVQWRADRNEGEAIPL